MSAENIKSSAKVTAWGKSPLNFKTAASKVPEAETIMGSENVNDHTKAIHGEPRDTYALRADKGVREEKETRKPKLNFLKTATNYHKFTNNNLKPPARQKSAFNLKRKDYSHIRKNKYTIDEVMEIHGTLDFETLKLDEGESEINHAEYMKELNEGIKLPILKSDIDVKEMQAKWLDEIKKKRVERNERFVATKPKSPEPKHEKFELAATTKAFDLSAMSKMANEFESNFRKKSVDEAPAEVDMPSFFQTQPPKSPTSSTNQEDVFGALEAVDAPPEEHVVPNEHAIPTKHEETPNHTFEHTEPSAPSHQPQPVPRAMPPAPTPYGLDPTFDNHNGAVPHGYDRMSLGTPLQPPIGDPLIQAPAPPHGPSILSGMPGFEAERNAYHQPVNGRLGMRNNNAPPEYMERMRWEAENEIAAYRHQKLQLDALCRRIAKLESDHGIVVQETKDLIKHHSMLLEHNTLNPETHQKIQQRIDKNDAIIRQIDYEFVKTQRQENELRRYLINEEARLEARERERERYMQERYLRAQHERETERNYDRGYQEQYMYSPGQWFYRDPNDTAQGPFSSKRMREWLQNKFFVKSTLIAKHDARNQFARLGDYFSDLEHAFLEPVSNHQYPQSNPPPAEYMQPPMRQEHPLDNIHQAMPRQNEVPMTQSPYMPPESNQRFSPPQEAAPINERQNTIPPMQSPSTQPVTSTNNVATEDLGGLAKNLKAMLKINAPEVVSQTEPVNVNVKKEQPEPVAKQPSPPKPKRAVSGNPWGKVAPPDTQKRKLTLAEIQEEEKRQAALKLKQKQPGAPAGKLWANLVSQGGNVPPAGSKAGNAFLRPTQVVVSKDSSKEDFSTPFWSWSKTQLNKAGHQATSENLSFLKLCLTVPDLDLEDCFMDNLSNGDNVVAVRKFAEQFKKKRPPVAGQGIVEEGFTKVKAKKK